ncbi:MAG: DNA-deoxyinosine glycosylase [Clostridia bacterium]|nr:DNA-deoxyinosine glycosylase [Clostridia bacterium]
MIAHPIAPIFNSDSKILILGSFPSVKSRESGFFYGHKQNRFWRVVSAELGCAVPQTVEEKKAMLLSNGIAVWDVVAECDIVGSADSTLNAFSANDIKPLLERANIKAIFTNGKKAFELYNRLILPKINVEAICLPSTSPANAALSLEALIERWQIITKYL